MSGTASAVDVSTIPAIGRDEASRLATTGYERFAALLSGLTQDEWAAPTDCEGWTVHDIAAHVVALCEGLLSMRELVRQMLGGRRNASSFGGNMLDATNDFQVRQRREVADEELVRRLEALAPRVVRRRATSRIRRVKANLPTLGKTSFAYLFDVILNRDVWMHTVDVSRACGKPLVLDASYDGRIVADVVAEWARTHGQPFTLRLSGPAGGTFASRSGGPELSEDAVEFCRMLTGRAAGEGLFATAVPF